MRHPASIFLFCMCWTGCLSQEQQPPAKNGMSLELLGVAGLGSVNYEHFFSWKEKRFLTFRVGVGLAPQYLDFSGGVNVGLPHGITINFGRKNYFETGVLGNLLFVPDEGESPVYFAGPAIGYRRQTPKSFFRVYFAALYIAQDSGFLPNLGLAFGFPFRKRDG